MLDELQRRSGAHENVSKGKVSPSVFRLQKMKFLSLPKSSTYGIRRVPAM